jgi:hypothetical protein
MMTFLVPLALFALLFAAGANARKKVNSNPATRFVALLAIGVICSWIPFGPLSVIFGFPAVLLNAIVVTFVLDAKEGK